MEIKERHHPTRKWDGISKELSSHASHTNDILLYNAIDQVYL